ncbi:MAG TPA: hypothetical protein VGN14_09965 [Candidatus Elarobacter sp.]|jgi:predicted small secreted protein
MNKNRSLVLAALAAAFALGGCATSAGTGATIPTVAPQSDVRETSAVAIGPATLNISGSATLHSVAGQTQYLSCAFQITTADPHGAWALFVMSKSPAGPAIDVIVPDLSNTPIALTMPFFPGVHLWSGAAGETQTHCVDAQITVPATATTGTYTSTLQYALLENIHLGLYTPRATGTATISTTVGAAFHR